MEDKELENDAEVNESLARISKDPCLDCKIKHPSLCVCCAKKRRQKRVLKMIGKE